MLLRDLIEHFAVKGLSAADFARGDDGSAPSLLPSIRDPLLDNVWYFAAVRRIATSIAQVPWVVARRAEDGTPGDPVTTGPVFTLFRDVNPQMSATQLWEALIYSYLIHGEWILLLDTETPRAPSAGNMPKWLRPLPPPKMKHELNRAKTDVVAWRLEERGRRQRWPEEAVLHDKIFNPSNPFRGLPILNAFKRDIEADLAAAEWNRRTFATGEPVGHLSTEQKIGQTDAQLAADAWRARYMGIYNRGKIAVLGQGLKYEATGGLPKDMEFGTLREWTRAAVLGALGVPLLEVSVLGDINRATAEVVNRTFWQRTLMPIMRSIEDKFATEFFPLIAPELMGYFATETVESLQPDMVLKLGTAKELWSMGVPLDRVDEMLQLGIGHVPGGETGYLPAGLVPAGLLSDFSEMLGEGEEAPPPTELSGAPALITRAAKNARRSQLWRAMLAAQAPMERKLRGRLHRYFYDLRSEVLAKLAEVAKGDKLVLPLVSKQDDDEAEEFEPVPEEEPLGPYRPGPPLNPVDVRSVLFNLERAREHLMVLMNPYTREMIARAIVFSYIEKGLACAPEAGKAARWTNGKVATIRCLTVDDPRVQAFVREKQMKTVRIPRTLHERLRLTLEQAAREGVGQAVAADRIRDTFNIARQHASTIARTELAQVMNGARWEVHEHMYERGIVRAKTWTTAGDERVRDDHETADGQQVGINEHFVVGGALLLYPGDVNGPPEQIINCRCIETVD